MKVRGVKSIMGADDEYDADIVVAGGSCTVVVCGALRMQLMVLWCDLSDSLIERYLGFSLSSSLFCFLLWKNPIFLLYKCRWKVLSYELMIYQVLLFGVWNWDSVADENLKIE